MNELEAIATVVSKALSTSPHLDDKTLDELIPAALLAASYLTEAGYGTEQLLEHSQTAVQEELLIERIKKAIAPPVEIPLDDFLEDYLEKDYLSVFDEMQIPVTTPVQEEESSSLYSDAELELDMEFTHPHPGVSLGDPGTPVLTTKVPETIPLVKDRGPSPSWATIAPKLDN